LAGFNTTSCDLLTIR